MPQWLGALAQKNLTAITLSISTLIVLFIFKKIISICKIISCGLNLINDKVNNNKVLYV